MAFSFLFNYQYPQRSSAVTTKNFVTIIGTILLVLPSESLVHSKPQSSAFSEFNTMSEDGGVVLSGLRSFNVPPLSPIELTPVEQEGNDSSMGVDYFGNSKINSRIVGGVETLPNEYPWQAYLQMEMMSGKYYACGGSLIADRWVLTAGHCVQIPGEQLKTVLVVLGMHDRSSSTEVNRKVYQGATLFVHPSFNANTLNADLAIIQLPTAVQLSNFIKPIVFARSSEPNHVSDAVTITGWGRTSDASSNTSPVLRKVVVPVISNTQCQYYYSSDIVNAGMICTSSSNSKGTCNGDSGGPMNFKQTDGTWKQIGITSFTSSRGCQSGGPNGFTRISYYSSWIENILATWTPTTSKPTTTFPTTTPSSTTYRTTTEKVSTVATTFTIPTTLATTLLPTELSTESPITDEPLTEAETHPQTEAPTEPSTVFTTFHQTSTLSPTTTYPTTTPSSTTYRTTTEKESTVATTFTLSTTTETTPTELPTESPTDEPSTEPPTEPTKEKPRTTEMPATTKSSTLYTTETENMSTPTMASTTLQPKLSSTTTSKPKEFSCIGKPSGNYPNPSSACSNTFYMCSNELVYVYVCPQGLVYRSETNNCDWSSNVDGCK